MIYLGFLYSPAYPLGPRLGVTVYWQPAAIQDVFLAALTRRCLVISQWLILWFYTQKIYLASLDIVNTASRSTTMLVGLSYFSAPRALWRAKRRKVAKRRRRFIRLRRARTVGSLAPLFSDRVYLVPSRRYGMLAVRRRAWMDQIRPFSELVRRRRYGYSASLGVVRKTGNYFLYYTQRLATVHKDLLKRILGGFYRGLLSKRLATYQGPRRGLKGRGHIIRKRVTAGTTLFVNTPFSLTNYRQAWLIKFFTRRRRFMGRFLFRRFARKSAGCRARLINLRFFWYLKLCFETYFRQRVVLTCTNLYLSYFQAGVMTRLNLRERSVLNRYITGIKRRRQFQVSKFRRLARDLSFRPGKPATVNKFSYTQIVLFLGLHPGWRKLINAYVLCYLVIVSALLKNVQVLSQWLYNMVSLGQTRRFRLMRMRFFMLLAKLLRDYAVFGQYLKGFRIEVYGKTGRSQKTRTRFFGDTSGLQYYRLSFRMNYQAFDIPTFAGVLGVRFWLY